MLRSHLARDLAHSGAAPKSPKSLASAPRADCGVEVKVLSGLESIISAAPAARANATAYDVADSFRGRTTGDFGAVFVVANGENAGVWLRYHPQCLGTLARAAADMLKPARSRKRGLFLYSIAGRPIDPSHAGHVEPASQGRVEGLGRPVHLGVARSLRLLQLLVEGEAWVWGGVAPGFAFRVGAESYQASQSTSQSISQSSVVLRTVSLSPKVLQVARVLSDEVIDAVLTSGKARMIRSPERHYAPGFENYRTSKSSFLTGFDESHAVVRRTCQMAARLSEPSWVEWPQLLRYDPGDWYQPHRDTFHDYKHPNAKPERSALAVEGKPTDPTLHGWLAFLRLAISRFDRQAPHASKWVSSLEGSALDPRFEPSYPADITSPKAEAFSKRVCELLLEAAAANGEGAFEGGQEGGSVAVGAAWLEWLEANLARGSRGLLQALVGESGTGKGRPDLVRVVRRVWEKATAAPDPLVWTLDRAAFLADSGGGGGGGGEAVGKEPGWKEDLLGPPWVEPNRHCTLMFYLNRPASGGGETTFPLASTHALVPPPNEAANEGVGACPAAEDWIVPGAAGVSQAGMPSCSEGLRVAPFKGGGALFYHKLGDGTNDPLSSHGGCPPLPPQGGALGEGENSVAWKINGFMWNTDSNQGPKYFG